MNKKLMAVAVAGALAVPAIAFAQASNVTISGRAVVGIDQYEAKGATGGSSLDYKARTRIYDSSSRLIIQGVEQLGNGLQAYFYNESGVNMDTGTGNGQNGTTNTSSGFLASRNAWAGLRGNWGAVQFGKPNVWWGNGQIFQNAAASWFSTEIPFLTGSMSRGMGPGVARQPNTMTYISPVFAGMTATLHYSTNGSSNLLAQSSQETQPATCGTGATATSCNTDAMTYALTLDGNWGAWLGHLDYVKAKGNTPTGAAVNLAQGTSEAYKMSVQWSYQPGAGVKLFYLNAKQKQGGSGATPSAALLALGSDLKQDAWAVGWDHTFGNWVPTAQYGWLKDIQGCTVAGAVCTDTGATSWQIGVRYLLSKRTWITAQWAETSNKKNANMDYTGAAMTSATTLNLGSDPRIVGIGIAHLF